jgi:CheY-like chemotaxis protein
VLIDRGLLPAEAVARAQAHAVREHIELADALVVLGLLSETQSYEALAAAAGTTLTPVDLLASSELALQLVPERLARRHMVVPLMVDNRTLSYATCAPFSPEAERDLGFASGRRTTVTIATRSAVLNGLDRCYPKLRYLDVLAQRLRAGSSEPADATGQPPAAAAPAPVAPAVGRKRSRILVTDDEPITRMLVKLLLEREHYDVLEATNGDQAVEIALRERPSLLLIDLNMPVMDGYQAIHYLRKTMPMSTLPIIVLTAEDGQSIERRVLELGANDYIIKPFDPGILLARVSGVFGRAQMMAA